jgi:two-component sensor histidine kinase
VRHRIGLGGGPDAASGARAAIDLITVELFDALACEQLRLMVSELVSNSVRHGGATSGEDRIELAVSVSSTTFRVECSDPIGGFDVLSPPSGFGLTLINACASQWGVRHGAAGSTWFEFPMP